MTTKPANATRRRLSAEERKADFLAAAARLIREKGLEGLTMEGLAAYCGVNKALPYQHFANRDDVLVALYDKENQEFDTRNARAVEHAHGFEARIRALINTWYEDVRNGTGTPELMHARTQTGMLEARRKLRMQVAADYIVDLIRESYDIRPDQARLAANVLLAGSQGLAAFWRTAGEDHAALTEAFITMALGAVQAVSDR